MNDQAKQLAPIKQITGLLRKMEPEFAKALPAHIKPEKFIRAASTALQNEQIIAKINEGKLDTNSLLNACTKAAQDGLLLDNREAALLTFYDKSKQMNVAQYIPMVQGLLKKARNSGKISKIECILVHANDEFSFNPSVDSAPHHPIDWFEKDGERGEMVGAYVVATLNDGSIQVEIMNERQIMNIAGQSKNAFQYQKNAKNAGEWWRKTVIRRACKYLPSSSDLDDLNDYADRTEFDYNEKPRDVTPPQAAEEKPATTEPVTTPAKSNPKKRTAAAQRALDKKANKEKEIIDADFEEIDKTTGEVLTEAPPMAPDDAYQNEGADNGEETEGDII